MAELGTLTIRMDDERMEKLLRDIKRVKRTVHKMKWQKAIELDRHKQYAIVR